VDFHRVETRFPRIQRPFAVRLNLRARASGRRPGSRLVAQLRARLIPVMAILENRSREADQDRLNALGATLAFVDASRIESYAQALADAEIAISCMASRNVHVDSTDDFLAIDRGCKHPLRA
jgi:hypothetical protein